MKLKISKTDCGLWLSAADFRPNRVFFLPKIGFQLFQL
jgi:hypothetical protein